MAFGGQMHHAVGLEVREGGVHGGAVANIGLEEMIARVVFDIAQRGEIAGIGQLVDIEHGDAGLADEITA